MSPAPEGRVREVARAKLNLRLRVLGRSEEGFHALETIYLRLGLADEVEVRSAEEGIGLTVVHDPARDVPAGTAGGPGGGSGEQGSLFEETEKGPSRGEEGGVGTVDASPGGGGGGNSIAQVPDGPENLCWRAAERFHAALGRDPEIAIRLVKRIPAGAGLGGGSADAAAVLRALDRLLDRPLDHDELLDIAGEIGSDVPFALADVPAALGWERGRRLLPLAAPDPRPMLLVVPGARISTPDAFAWLDERRDATGGGRRAGTSVLLPSPEGLGGWDGLLRVACNDFEDAVFLQHPQLGWWKEELLGEGAVAALLCGSGSALCGVFAETRRRDAAADRLREGTEVCVVSTRGPV